MSERAPLAGWPWPASALLGALLWAAAFPPLGLWPAALVAVLPLAQIARRAPTARRAAARLFVTGLAIHAWGNLWMAETSLVNLAVVVVLQAGWLAVFGAAARRALPGRPAFPALPLLWVAHEWLRMRAPLSGYPWLHLGQSLAQSEVLVQAADLGGVLLLGFVAASGAALLLDAAAGRRGAARAAAAVLVAATLYGYVRPFTLQPSAPGPLLATIQPAFPQELKENPISAQDRYRRCLDLSRQAVSTASRPPDLLVWPETMWPLALPAHAPDDPDAARLLEPLFAPVSGQASRALLIGAVIDDGEAGADALGRRYANGALLFGADGALVGRYDKHHLVPGGETVPWGDVLPEVLRAPFVKLIRSVAGFVADLAPGPGPVPVAWDGHMLGVTICFENAYGEHGRRLVAAGATFLVNLSNEGWFGTSTEFDHMELHSVLRAVETRRALFRSTNSGISCLVRPDGRRPQGADRFAPDGRDRAVAGVFSAQVPLHGDRTLYVRWGDHPFWLVLLGAAWIVLRPRLS